MTGEICFYGTAATGAGYLARAENTPFTFYGDGDPVPGRSFTRALWLALDQLHAAGVTGAVRVYDSGGERMCEIPVTYRGYYGSIDRDVGWKPAPVYTFSIETLTAVAEKV